MRGDVLLSTLLASLVLAPDTTFARNCEDTFVTQSAATQSLVESDAYRQWLSWERLANIPINKAIKERVELPTAEVSSSLVDVQALGELSPALKSFFSTQSVLWPRHPFNRASDKVPFHDVPATRSMNAGVTASRSLSLEQDPRQRYTIKLATDTVQERNPGYEPGKLRTEYDIAAAIARADFITKRDEKLGPPKGYVILHDVLTVADKKSGRGYIVRDISLLNDGHYYLPAFAIPVLGREIAAHNLKDFDSFWQQHYAEPLGRFKADFLLRYGLQMETPNAQNFLIQLDRNLRPTGLLVVRDIADSVFVDVFARGLGIDDIVIQDFSRGRGVEFKIVPYWENSFQHFGKMLGYYDKDYESRLVPEATIRNWAKAHNTAFASRMNRMLPDLSKNSQLRMEEQSNEALEIYQRLRTEEGQAALKRLR